MFEQPGNCFHESPWSFLESRGDFTHSELQRPPTSSRTVLCSLVLVVCKKVLFLSLFPFFFNVLSSCSFSHSPGCACVTVTRCYISSPALSSCRVKLWASAFGGEIKSIAAKYSGSQLLQKVRFLW